MKPITVLQKHDLNLRSSVVGVYDGGSNHAIALFKEPIIRKRGFHLNDEDLLNIFHNLPIEFKGKIRFIKNQEEIEWYNAVKEIPEINQEQADKIVEQVNKAIKKKKIVVEPREKLGTEKENERLESFLDDEVDVTILKEDYSEFSQEQLVNYRKRLKDFAKTFGIKIPPATKNIGKIIARILPEVSAEEE